MEQKKYRCLCCGYRTLDTRGEFDICPVCYWEDEPYLIFGDNKKVSSVYYSNNCESDDYDGSDIIDTVSASNDGITLRQGRKNFLEIGACCKEMLEHVRPPYKSEREIFDKENKIENGELIMNFNKSWENSVRKVVPYTPGEQPKDTGIIKLNTNENPYPPAPSVRKILDNFNISDMRLYPAPDSAVLVNAIAETYSVKPSQVFVGVGSDDVISMAFMTFFNSNKPILFPNITYSFYDVWADVYRIPYQTKPLNPDFTINPEDYKVPNGGIIFPNPNAPTGVLESIDMIEEIVKANSDSVVMIDEAYIDFGGKSCIGLVEKYENLLVIQTYSKSRSMAGMRIGFAIGSEKLIKYMNDVKFSVNSYTMNTVTQLCGAEVLKDEEYFKSTVNKIIATRERSKQRLSELGFTFPDSKSNFIFAKPEQKSAKYVFDELRKRKIFVRYWDKPVIKDYLRITVGTDEEMDNLFRALEEILNG